MWLGIGLGWIVKPGFGFSTEFGAQLRAENVFTEAYIFSTGKLLISTI
jgi:hypothetical protein